VDVKVCLKEVHGLVLNKINDTCLFIFKISYSVFLLIYETSVNCSSKFPHKTLEIVLLTQRQETLIFVPKLKPMNYVAVKPAVRIKTVPGYCSTPIAKSIEKCVGKCGVVERALCCGLHGGLLAYGRLLRLIISY
jgi:hypothetical protein